MESKNYSPTYNRIPVEQAEAMLRARDGVEPGSVTVDLTQLENTKYINDSFLERFQEHVDIDKFSVEQITEDEDLITDMVLDHDGEGTEYFRKGLEGLHFCEAVGNVLKQIDDMPEEAHDVRLQTITQYYDAFLELYPDAVLDPTLPGSITGIRDFVSFYQHEAQEVLAFPEVVAKVAQYRDEMIETLDAPQFARLLPKYMRERVKRHVATIPIHIVDPLQAAVNRMQSGSDAYGWFLPTERRCYVDPLSMMNGVAGANPEDIDKVFDQQLAQIVFHELWHTTTNVSYRHRPLAEGEADGDEYEHIELAELVYGIWPESIREAMVEKLAVMTLLARNQIHDIELSSVPSSRNQKESAYRRYLTNMPPQLLLPKNAVSKLDQIRPAYREYRVGIDTIMHRLDWEAAGVSPREAEKLLARAFVELPTGEPAGTPEVRCPHRKAFFEALHKASYPGFFNKLRMVEELVGYDSVLNIVESPVFDPHDANAIPWLTSPVTDRRLRADGSEKSIQEQAIRIKRMRSLGAGEAILSGFEARLQRCQLAVGRLALLNEARAGLRSHIWHEFGRRERRITGADRMFMLIDGKKAQKPLEKFTSKDYEAGQAALEQWKQARAERVDS